MPAGICRLFSDLDDKSLGAPIVVLPVPCLPFDQFRDVNHLNAGRVLKEKLHYPVEAQRIPMVIAMDTETMIRNRSQVEEGHPRFFSRNAEAFSHRGLESFSREVFKKVMDKEVIEGGVIHGDLEGVADEEVCFAKPYSRVHYVFPGEVES